MLKPRIESKTARMMLKHIIYVDALAKNKCNAKALINALGGMTVDGMTAARLGLSTRHVTMKNRGGLVFASSAYYKLMNKIENRFYSTVCFSYVLFDGVFYTCHTCDILEM